MPVNLRPFRLLDALFNAFFLDFFHDLGNAFCSTLVAVLFLALFLDFLFKSRDISVFEQLDLWLRNLVVEVQSLSNILSFLHFDSLSLFFLHVVGLCVLFVFPVHVRLLGLLIEGVCDEDQVDQDGYSNEQEVNKSDIVALGWVSRVVSEDQHEVEAPEEHELVSKLLYVVNGVVHWPNRRVKQDQKEGSADCHEELHQHVVDQDCKEGEKNPARQEQRSEHQSEWVVDRVNILIK